MLRKANVTQMIGM